MIIIIIDKYQFFHCCYYFMSSIASETLSVSSSLLSRISKMSVTSKTLKSISIPVILGAIFSGDPLANTISFTLGKIKLPKIYDYLLGSNLVN